MITSIDSEKLTPINGVIIVDFRERAEEHKDRLRKIGLTAPETSDMQGVPNQGKVLAVCSTVEDVAVGDLIIFDQPSPIGFKWKGEKVLAIHKDNVCGVISE